MVTEIRVYIEGGGDSKDTKAFLRQGFNAFLKDLISAARSRRIRWNIVMCGGRDAAFDAFRTALQQHSDAFNVLLVDSEVPVVTTPWHHLQERDGWGDDRVSDDHCQLMTQTMEAWFIADVEALSTFYGPEFRRGCIPRNPDVEQIAKADLEASLRSASRDTLKGEYHKIRHASGLLKIIDASTVRRASRHCDRLFTILAAKMEQSPLATPFHYR